MADIKMLITDLDGTFMESHYVPNERNIVAMNMAMTKGVICCACTARNWSQAQYPVRYSGFNDCVVLCNGAAIIDTQTMDLRYRNRLDPKALKRLLRIIGSVDDASLSVFLTDSIASTHDKMSDYLEVMHTQRNNSPQRRYELVTLTDTMEELFEVSKDTALLVESHSMTGQELPSRMYEQIIETGEYSLTSAHPGSIQVMAQGVSKFEGVKILSDIYDIPRENIMCIGDNQNDMGMIEWAGVGVAVGNAEDEVKDIADYVSCANTEGAVAQAIEKYIL